MIKELKGKKELLVAFIFVIDYLCLLIANQDFYWWVSDVVKMFETLLFLAYILGDFDRFKTLPKIIFVSIFTLFTINFILSFNIMFIKLSNRNYCTEHIENIISSQYENYISDYSNVFVIFMVIIIPLIWIKLQKK